MGHIKERLNTCEKHNNRLILEKSSEDCNSETKWIELVLEQYNTISNEARIFLSKFGNSVKIINNLEQPTDKKSIHLEKLKFQVFDGQMRRYPKFKEEFLKHIRPQYPKDKEAFALRAYLSEEVREEISSLGDDIEQIWKRLDSKYGREGKLIDLIMNEVKRLGHCRDDTPESTLSLINVVEKAYYDLKALGREKEVSNSAMVALIEEKLPTEIAREWEKMVTDESREYVERDKFPNLLNLLCQFKNRLEYRLSDIRKAPKGGVHFRDTTKREDGAKPMIRSPWCWIHPERDDHPVWRCEEFAAMDANERLELVRKHDACFRCLDQGHKTRVCRRNFFCKVDKCGAPHHHLLHDSYVSGHIAHCLKKTTILDEEKEKDVLLMLQRIKGGRGCMSREPLNVLWDGGSTLSLITFTSAKRLTLGRIQNVRLQIVKIGGKVEELDSHVYEVEFIDIDGQKVSINALGIDKISSTIVRINMKAAQRMFWDIDISTIDRPCEGEIDCLIGLDYAGYHPVREKAAGHLLLLRNRFGQVIGGAHPNIKEGSRKLIHHAFVMHANIHVEDFYNIEKLGVECSPKCGGCKCGQCQPGGSKMSIKEEREYKLIEEGMKFRNESKRWEASYPWIKDPSDLPDNKAAALSCLSSLEKRLKDNKQQSEVYKSQIEDMLERGVCRKVSKEELNEYEGPKYYIAHHAVMKPSSKSTPCRIVFNSSANYKGHILNDYFAKGPDLLNNLLEVLLRFREERIGLAGDISKMFHSVSIPLHDKMTHLFLWRNFEAEREPDTYAITAVNFGDKPSAAIAIVALQKTANFGIEKYPEAAKSIADNSYMDDIIDSTQTPKKAHTLTKDINDILRQGGFSMKEWVFSDRDDKIEVKTSGGISSLPIW